MPLTGQDDPLAAEQTKCEAHAVDCGVLAVAYADGKGVRADRARAVQFATRACDAESGVSP